MKYLSTPLPKCLFVLAATSPWARAATGFRNGGDAVLCFAFDRTADNVRHFMKENRKKKNPYRDPLSWSALNELRSVELLDLYQMQRSGFAGNDPLIAPAGDFLAQAQERLDLLVKLSPARFAERVEAERARLPEDLWVGMDSGVVEVSDFESEFFLPRRCVLAQFAMQSQGRVLFDRRLLDRLPPLHQSAFIVHEWLVGLIQTSKPRKSGPTPQDVHLLTGLLFRKDFESREAAAFERWLADHRFLEF